MEKKFSYQPNIDAVLWSYLLLGSFTMKNEAKRKKIYSLKRRRMVGISMSEQRVVLTELGD